MITIVYHNRRNKKTPAGAIYVGRPSPLGNPFIIGRDGDRYEVVRKYDEWLRDQLTNEHLGNPAQLEFDRLVAHALDHKRIELECWCAPQRCHAEVIGAHILNFVEEHAYD